MLNHFFLNNFDEGVAVWFLHHRQNFGINFFSVISFFGNWQFVLPLFILLLLFLYLKNKNSLEALQFFLIVATAEAITFFAKIFFERPRPLSPALAETDFSFPSGHATIAIAFYGYLAYWLIKQTEPKYKKIIVALAILWAGLIGFSRIYLGVHYVSDVLAGYLVGGSALILGINFVNKKTIINFMKNIRVKILMFCLVIVILCSATEFVLWQKKIATTKMVENSKIVSESNVIKVPTTTSPIKKVDIVEYRNEQYGFVVSLPLTWTGYSIVSSTWVADKINAAGENVTAASGPLISVRNPKWTKKNPYQDIPVMIFTMAQWSDIQSEAMHIGAAPIPPSELSRNTKYVFALPARYNFAFPTGFEEVDKIIQGNAVSGF